MFAYWQMNPMGKWTFRTSTDAPIIDKSRKIKLVRVVDERHRELPFFELQKLYGE